MNTFFRSVFRGLNACYILFNAYSLLIFQGILTRQRIRKQSVYMIMVIGVPGLFVQAAVVVAIRREVNRFVFDYLHPKKTSVIM